jgi:integrase
MKPKRTKRIRLKLAKGIYRDEYGIDVLAHVGSGKYLRTKRKRFSLTDADGREYSKQNGNLAALEFARERLRFELTETPEAKRGRGTLAAAIDSYLEQPFLTGGKKVDFTYLLAHWKNSDLGAMDPDRIKRSQIKAQLGTWKAAGVANVTLNHRLRALRAVDTWLHPEDDDDDNRRSLMTDKIEREDPPDPEPRGIPIPIVQRILSHLPDRGRPTKGKSRPPVSHTKIRLHVLAFTGLPASQLIRLARTAVNFREGRMLRPRRPKGKGAPAGWIDLLPAAVEALKQYDEAGLWKKSFSNSSVNKSFKRAIANTRAALEREAEQTGDSTLLEQFTTAVPDDCSTYDLKHSFLTDAYETTGDIHAVAALGQHTDPKTTERYTKAAVPKRVALAIAKMREAWAALPPPPAPAARSPQKFKVVARGA